MREQIREFKKQRILEVAERLFYECGYEATSIDTMASELSVTRPFIYSYFPNKAAILEALYERGAERLLGYMEEDSARGGAPESRLRILIRAFVLENIRNQVANGVYLQEEKHLLEGPRERINTVESRFHKHLALLIEEGVAQKVFKVKHPHLASLCISGMVRWVHRWYHADGRASADQIADQIAAYAMRMVNFEENGSRHRATS